MSAEAQKTKGMKQKMPQMYPIVLWGMVSKMYRADVIVPIVCIIIS